MDYSTLFTGQRLGMFSGGAGALAPGRQPAIRLEDQPDFKKLSPEKQNELREQSLRSGIELQQTMGVLEPFFRQPSLGELEASEERRARRAQEIGKESLREGFKYATLANLPRNISQSFGNIAALNILGARNATEVMADTLASYPRAQFSQYQFQPQKYFG
jgi:hypothetical protein